MKKIERLLKRGVFCSMIVSALSMPVICVQTEASPETQTYEKNNCIWTYFSGIGSEVISAGAQIGNITDVDVSISKPGQGEGTGIHTTILFDNSLSIVSENRDRMKEVVRGLISNHAENETFTLSTFDTEIRVLSADSQNYDDLLAQADAIQFVNQDTYLKNVLYQAFESADTEGIEWQRFIVLSDGSDDNEVGYTYNEISAIVKSRGYAVYSVGSRYEKKIDALEEMFAISRAAGSGYYLLDDSANVDGIVSEINSEIPAQVACIQIPDSVMDGSEKSIQITLTTNEGEKKLTVSAEMPFANLEEIQPSPEPSPTLEPVVTEEPEESVEKNNSGDQTLFYIIGAAVILLIILLAAVIIRLKQKKKNSTPGKENKVPEREDSVPDQYKAESEEEDDGDETILLREEEDDDRTVLLKKDNNEETVLLKMLVLEAEDTGKRYEIRCESEITIGRRQSCDICITGDAAVSGVHCRVKCDNENLIVIDEGSSNGTYLNDVKVTEGKMLEDGDTLEIGRNRYKVRITSAI